MRISDWSSDVCSSDLDGAFRIGFRPAFQDLPVGTAIGESFRLTWLITKEVGGTLSRLVRGSGREEISSPIGLVRDRKSVVSGKSVSVRVDLGGRRIIKKKKIKHSDAT